jgi:2-dehydropantoate 2-reductase
MNEFGEGESAKHMRLVVVGAGQMGAIYGAAAHENGHDVCFIDTDQTTVDAINHDGLRIDRQDGHSDVYRIDAKSEPSDSDPKADVALVMVKGWATAAAAARVAPVVDGNTLILTLQNGLGNEEVLRSAFPGNEILIGVSVHTVVTLGAGHYSHTGVRDTHLGPSCDDGMVAAQTAGALFAREDFPVHVLSESDVRREQWGKFVLNCASLPTAALTRLPTAAVRDMDVLFKQMDDVTRETCAIGRAEGIELDTEERVAFQHDLLRTAGGRASMLGDVLAGRRTEVDTINGAAIMYADKHGLAAPLNRMLFALVKGLDRSFELTTS